MVPSLQFELSYRLIGQSNSNTSLIATTVPIRQEKIDKDFREPEGRDGEWAWRNFDDDQAPELQAMNSQPAD